MISALPAPSTRRWLSAVAAKLGRPELYAAIAVLSGGLLTATLDAQIPSVAPTASPTAAATPATKADLLSVLKAAGNFKTFLKAVEAADLSSVLQKPGQLTVFAPTDTAFSKMPAGTLDELLKPENKAKLVKLVSYHLASGKFTASDLVKADEVKTLEGTEIDVEASTDGKTIEVDEAKVLGNDIEAANGVLHAIDSVLQP